MFLLLTSSSSVAAAAIKLSGQEKFRRMPSNLRQVGHRD